MTSTRADPADGDVRLMRRNSVDLHWHGDPSGHGVRAGAEVTGKQNRAAGLRAEPVVQRRATEVVRRPGDIVRLGAGLLIVGLSGWAAILGVSKVEVAAFRLANELPVIVDRPLVVVMQAGALAAVPVTAGVALLARRVRLARDVAVSGSLAWFLAKIVKAVVSRERPQGLVPDALVRQVHTGLGFPSGHAAVAAALVTAAAPYLPPRVRRVAWLVVAMVALARLYVGAHLPLDVIGGAALGYAAGAFTHLVFGVPRASADTAVVRHALAALGLHPTVVERVSADARASVPYLAVDGQRRLFVKAVGRSQHEADALFHLWRFLTLRQAGDEPPYTSVKQQVEHEAYLSLLAARAGVRTPALIGTTRSDDSTVFLVQEHVDGHSADAVPSARLDDTTLADMWTQVAALHAARIAHRDLRLANLLVDSHGRAWVIDFGFAQAGADSRQLAGDVAQLLASLAFTVGPDRAVRSALTALEPAELARSLPLLQAAELPSATQSTHRARPGVLEELRTEVARVTGVTVPALPPLTRVRWPTVLLVIALGVAVHGLLPQLGQAGRALLLIPTAKPAWVAAAVAASAVTYVFAALVLTAASPRRLLFGRTVAVQLAGSFVNRLAPGGLGGLSLNARYLRRAGLQPSEASAALTAATSAGFVVHAVALVVTAGWMGRVGLADLRQPHRWPVLVGVVLILAVAGVVVFLPRVKSHLLPALRTIRRQCANLAKAPARGALLVLGSGAITICYALALDGAMHAVGQQVPLISVMAVYLVGLAASALSPTPSGLGAVETALTAGLTAVHFAFAPALAAVLIFRLATYWLPILPGFICYRMLRHQRAL